MPSTGMGSTLHVLPRLISTRTLRVCYLPVSWLQPSDLLSELRVQGPVLSSPAQPRRLLPVALVPLIPGLHLPCCLQFSRHYIVFYKEPSLFRMCRKQDSLSFVIFPPVVNQASLAIEPKLFASGGLGHLYSAPPKPRFT